MSGAEKGTAEQSRMSRSVVGSVGPAIERQSCLLETWRPDLSSVGMDRPFDIAKNETEQSASELKVAGRQTSRATAAPGGPKLPAYHTALRHFAHNISLLCLSYGPSCAAICCIA